MNRTVLLPHPTLHQPTSATQPPTATQPLVVPPPRSFPFFPCQNLSFFLALPHLDFFLFHFRCPATLPSSQSRRPHLGFFHFPVPPKTLPSSLHFGAKTLPSTFPFPTQIFSLSFPVLPPRFLTFSGASKPFLFGCPNF